MVHRFTDEQISWLTANVKGSSRRDLHARFNAHFGLELRLTQVVAAIKNRGLTNGLEGRFRSGHVPAHFGKKGVSFGGKATQFRPGANPKNWLPTGSEIVNEHGYTKVKVGEPKQWKFKHVLVWENLNGPLPQGDVVIFADGNRANFAPENLVRVSRSELLFLNRKKLISADPDLTKTAVNIAKVSVKLYERKKEIERG